MLTEVLLVLAGYPSGVIKPGSLIDPVLSNAEKGLLVQVAQFGQVHGNVKTKIDQIRRHSDSRKRYPACVHAIAAVIEDNIVGELDSQLLKLESDIVQEDSVYVGGNKIVSLSYIVSLTVKAWERRINYSDNLLNYIMSEESTCAIIERLNEDVTTGYGDLEPVANACLIAAQKAWIRMLSSWIVYGRLPFTTDAFMIKYNKDNDLYELVERETPRQLISESLATEILETGSSSAQLQSTQTRSSEHLSQEMNALDRLEFPVTSTSLERAVADIRSYVLRTVVQDILPVKELRHHFKLFRDIVLLGQVLFVDSLNSVDGPKWYLRQGLSGFAEDSKSVEDQATVKLAEKTLKYVQLDPEQQESQDDCFDDILFGTRWNLRIDPQWPNSLLLFQSHKQKYIVVFSLLTTIASIHSRVTSLWRSRNRSPQQSELWAMARQMKTFLDTLWEYYQLTVIDANFKSYIDSEFDKQQQANQVDPQAFIKSHEKFLNDTFHLLFVDDKTLRQILRKILVNSITLTELITHGGGPAHGTRAESVVAQLKEALTEFVARVSEVEDFTSRKNMLLLKLENVALA